MARKRPVPDDFAANARRPNGELARLYGVSESAVGKWRRATGLALRERGGGPTARPVPDDFAANAQRKNGDLELLYGVGGYVILRWRKETGLRGTNGRGPKKARPDCVDSNAEINVCLTCPALSCNHGDCARRKAAAL